MMPPLFSVEMDNHWKTASRESTNIATPAQEQKEPIVQVYVARAYNWRGIFACHTWIAFKRPPDAQYTVAEVIGFRLDDGLSVVTVRPEIPDRKWFDHPPEIIQTLTGEKAAKAIPQIEAAIESYPYDYEYRTYPGPNSNTFTAHIIRNVDQLTVELPPHAIGKDWLTDSYVMDLSETGTGVQASLFGLLGFTAGLGEGLEVNLLGMNLGVDFADPALKLPFTGRVGFDDEPVSFTE